MTFSNSNALSLASLAAFIVVLIFAVFGNCAQDDTHMTFTAAQNVANSFQILNHNGDSVEQGSSLLHVMLLGIISRITGIEALQLGLPFSILFGLFCLPLTLALASRLELQKPIVPVMLLALSTSFIYWSAGSLETTLAACCVLYLVFTVSAYVSAERFTVFNVNLCLAVCLFLLVRPETFFVLILFLVILACLSFRQHQANWPARLLVCLIYTLLAAVLLVGFRWLTFDQLFPQPVYAKSAGISFARIVSGIEYVFWVRIPSLVILCLPAIFLLYQVFVKGRKASVITLVTLSLFWAYMGFIVASGGDWMMAGRFFVPILPLMMCIACLYLEAGRFFFRTVILLMVLLIVEVVVWSIYFVPGVGISQAKKESASLFSEAQVKPYNWAELSSEVNFRDIPLIEQMDAIIRVIHEDQPKPINILSIQMGMVPYHLYQRFGTDVHFVDLFGLTTQHITQCKGFDDIPRTRHGVWTEYVNYFEVLNAELCDIPRPDIVYDLLNQGKEINAQRLQVLKDQGYHVVYYQDGQIKRRKDRPLATDSFIAVSEAIYGRLPEQMRYQSFHF